MNKKKHKSRWPKFSKDQTVYFTVFTKENSKEFFCARGVIEEAPPTDQKPVYKVRVLAVGTHLIGGKDELERQSFLVDRSISKHAKGLSRELSPLITPKAWYELRS